jgi:hypothetical protein
MTSKRIAALVCALGLIGCGGAAPRTETAAVVQAPRARPRSTGPVQSYVGDGDTVIVRIDLERVRSSSLSNDIASLVNSYPMWRELLGSSGIDPVRDFDRVLVAAPEAIADRSVLLIRHHLTNARIREAVLQLAVERGQQPEWETVDGFQVVHWPAQTEVPRIVVLTGEHELVVTTDADLNRVIAVAGDHAGRRSGDELIEPALALEEGTIATIVASDLGEGSGRRLRYPPDAFNVSIRETAAEERRIELSAQGIYADAGAADTARRYFSEQRDFYAGQMLVRAVGLDRPLREAQIGGEGNVVQVSASLTEEEIERVLGLVALGQMGGG